MEQEWKEEWLLPLFVPFPNSLIRAKYRFFKNGTANFGRNIPAEISGPPPVVTPNIHNGKHAVFNQHDTTVNADCGWSHHWDVLLPQPLYANKHRRRQTT